MTIGSTIGGLYISDLMFHVPLFRYTDIDATTVTFSGTKRKIKGYATIYCNGILESIPVYRS